MEDFTKEAIIEKRLFPYIPFYIARYEKEIAEEGNVDDAIKDLEYFRNEMIRLHKEGELSDFEIVDLMALVNTIITHITNGNSNEERLVNIMGGVVLETESERIIRVERSKAIKHMMDKGKTPEEISDLCGYDLKFVLGVVSNLKQQGNVSLN